MKIYDIPEVSLVEIQFEYMGETHKVKTVLVYKVNQTVYVSAIKSAAYIIPATKLKSVALIYRTELGVYSFRNLVPRSISYNGQHLYAMNTEEDAVLMNHRKDLRLYVGVSITAKVFNADGGVSNLYGVLRDISMTGMGIISNQKVDRMSKIEISFRVNRDKTIKLKGSIIHMNEFTTGKGFIYGCDFDEPNETIGRYVVKKYVQRNSLQQENYGL